MGQRFQTIESDTPGPVDGADSHGILSVADVVGRASHGKVFSSHHDSTFSSTDSQFVFGSPYEVNAKDGLSIFSASHEKNPEIAANERADYKAPSAGELRNSMTHVEGERVGRDKHGNTVIDRSHIAGLGESHPVKETIGRHGTTYRYRDGREVTVSRDGFISVEQFDPISGQNVSVIVGTKRDTFNPLL